VEEEGGAGAAVEEDTAEAMIIITVTTTVMEAHNMGTTRDTATTTDIREGIHPHLPRGMSHRDIIKLATKTDTDRLRDTAGETMVAMARNIIKAVATVSEDAPVWDGRNLRKSPRNPLNLLP